jgi:hypothetical protein
MKNHFETQLFIDGGEEINVPVRVVGILDTTDGDFVINEVYLDSLMVDGVSKSFNIIENLMDPVVERLEDEARERAWDTGENQGEKP